jgi:pimeloyl-ACP methyl ester carboxylesterase
VPRTLTLLLLLGLCGCGGPSTQAIAPDRIQLHDCGTQAFGNARCGTYEVWENRTANSGRRISLNILVLPARGSERRSDPVFYFDGGPGGSATAAAAFIARVLGPVNQSRDLVFVDVRGTGRSSALTCPMPADDAPLQRFFDGFLSDGYVRACLERQQADVRFYTQPIAMDDVDEVRQALGYDLINLFGSSGGTRQEQIYLRRHPSSVRSLAMHGVHPMDGELPLSFARALEDGMRWLINACTADVNCHRDYPDLAGDWERSKAQFESGPVETRLTDPRTGRSDQVRISRGVFADGIRHMLYNLDGAGDVADRVHAAAHGDFGPFAQAELRQVLMFSRTIADGFYLSSTCAEDVRFIDDEDLRRATEGTFLGDYRVRRQQAACRIWPKGEGVEKGFQRPVESKVPALLISGEVDVATPPSEAERVLAGLPNGRHVIFPFQGHDYANLSCASQLIAAFIDGADARSLDVACVARTSRSVF